MVVDKVHKVEEVVTKEWKNWNLYSFLVQKVSDSMAWFNFTQVHTVLTKLPHRSINHHFCNMQYM